jgi:hypothetical protein
MNKYNFKSNILEKTSKKKSSKNAFEPSKENKNIIAKKTDILVQNVNKIMRFNKEG